MLPDGWENTSLGEVCQIATGGTPNRAVPEYWNGDIPWMSSGEINQRIVRNVAEHITALGVANSNARPLPPGTVMMALNGQGKTRGKVALLDIETTCNQSLAGLIADRTRLLPDYLFYSLDAQYQDIRNITGDDARNGLNLGILRALAIALPPFDEQRRIAEVLRSVDEAIAAAEDALAASQAVHRLSLEALFGVCFSETHADGEKIATIRQVCERVTYGFTNPMPTTEEGPWMLTAANVRHGWIDYNSARHTSIEAYTNDISEKSRPPVGAVLVTKDGTLGRVARVDRVDVCINQSVAVLIPDATAVDGAFLSYLLQCPTGQDRMLADSGGSSVKHIYISKLAELPFALPPLEDQKERAMFAEESERAVQDQTRAVERLLALKSYVMSDLLSGRVRVPA